MYLDNWDDVSGNSPKDNLLGKIETENINILMKKIAVLRKSEDWLDSYTRDRKRELENLSKPDDVESYLEKMIYKIFSSEKLPKEQEAQLVRSTYLWYKMKDDPEIIEALRKRVIDLDYDVNDDESRSTNVRVMSYLMQFIPHDEKWKSLRDTVLERVSEFEFKDFMLFSTNAGSFYVLSQPGFEEILLEKIPKMSPEERYYYLQRADDGADGNSEKLIEVKRNSADANAGIFSYCRGQGIDLNNMKGLSKLNALYKTRWYIAHNIPWRIYDSEKEAQKFAERDKQEDEAIIHSSAEYPDYYKTMQNLSPIESVQYFSYLFSNFNGKLFNDEIETIKEKFKNLSRKGLLTIFMSSREFKDEEKGSFILKNDELLKIFAEKGVIDSNSKKVLATDEEKQKAKETADLYCEAIDYKKDIIFDWFKLDISPENANITDEVELEEHLVENYVDTRKKMENTLDIVRDGITMENLKDIQLVNIINKMNTVTAKDNEDEELSERRKWMDTYLKTRILSMNAGVASMLEMPENGKYNKFIETAVDQQEFIEDKDKEL